MKLYSVKDIKADRFNGPIMFPNEAMARRAFASAVNSDHPGLLSDYPEDAQIYCVGSFDDHSGAITPENTFVCTGLDLKKEDKHE